MNVARPSQELSPLLNEMGSHCIHSFKQGSDIINLCLKEILLLLCKEFTVSVD